jgi:COP9 signalosome complex subunit 4
MELSQSSAPSVSEKDRLQSLEYAISCAILAKAGPQRSRVLAMLYSDERSVRLPNFQMLEKMFKERIISQQEVQAFEKILQEHQKADTGNKRTVRRGGSRRGSGE